MPLTNNEVNEIEKLLNYILSNDLLLLSKTVTNNQLQIDTEDEAKKAIISFTQSPIQLLKRRKLKREYLFTYLFKEGGKNISPQMCKVDLIREVLTLWKSEFSENDINMEEVDANESLKIAMNDEIVLTPNRCIPTIAGDGDLESLGENFNIWTCLNDLLKPEEDISAEFCRWYFDMINAQADDATKTMNPSHFFPDCILQLIHMQNILQSEQRIFCDIGAVNVAVRLDLISKQENIKFNPNFSPQGMRCFSDRFGRKMILACGSMHRKMEHVGIFEQQFVLVRDIACANNWKIKFMRLAACTQINQPAVLEVTQKLLN